MRPSERRVIRRLALLVVTCAAVALLVGESAPTQSTTPFLVGFADDLPKEIGAHATDPARALGATAMRLTTQWSPSQTQLDPAEITRLDRAVAAASGLRLFLSVYGTAGISAPRDASARDTYCAFVRDILVRYATIRDVVIWNEPNKRLFWNPQTAADGSSLAPVEYQALLARCYDVVHAAVPSARVHGLALSSTGNDDAGSHSPGAFIRKFGDAYRASGRTAPLLDGVAFHPYPLRADERPWTRHVGQTTIGMGDWNKLMANLSLALSGSGQPLPGACAGMVCPRIWYLESGFQTAIDPAKAAAYTGTETVTPVLSPDAGGEPDTPPPAADSLAPDQRTQILDATRLAACQPWVAGILNFLLADEPRLAGWQSGALWADLTPKPSSPAFATAFATATAGTVDCDALKGGRPSSDYVAPPAPVALTATAGEGPLRVDVQWASVTDGSAPVSYRVYRGGALIATTNVLTWRDTTVARSETYTYVIRALDGAGNLGTASLPVDVSTSASPPPAGGGGGGGGGGAPAALSLSLDVARASLVPGQDVEARVVVKNAPGVQTAIDTRVVITLPDGVTLLGVPFYERGSGCSGMTTLTCLLDFLPAGTETPVRFWIDVGLAGERSIRVDVSAQNDAARTDSTATATLVVGVPASAARPGTDRSGGVKGIRRTGTPGADRIFGTPFADVLRGGAGADTILGRGGDDVILGGSGRDRIEGNDGNDQIATRDGVKDIVLCGRGRDLVIADRLDRVDRDCEQVVRGQGS